MKKMLLSAALVAACFYSQAQTVETYAGTGNPGVGSSGMSFTSAEFDLPYGIAVDSKNNVWVSDENNSIIALLQASDSKYYPRSGGFGYADGGSLNGRMTYPKGIVRGPGDTLFIVDNSNGAIRKLSPIETVGKAQMLTTIAGSDPAMFGGAGETGYAEGQGFDARFDDPAGLAIANDGSYLLVTDRANHVIRKVSLSGATYGMTSLVAGQPGVSGDVDGDASTTATFSFPEGIDIADNGDIYVIDGGVLRKISASNNMVTTILDQQKLYYPTTLVMSGNIMYIADGCNIKKYALLTKSLTVLVGSEDSCGFANGTGNTAYFDNITGLALSNDGKSLFVADSYNNRIRKVTLPTSTTPTAISEEKANRFTIYPNPARNYVVIENKANNENVTISLCDMTGKEIISSRQMNNGSIRFDFGSQPAGVYLLKVASASNVSTSRLIIK